MERLCLKVKTNLIPVEAIDPWKHGNQEVDSGIGKLVSGRVAKPGTGVKRQVVWPHTRVTSVSGSSITYDRLDLPELIIGELTIILDYSTPADERQSIARCYSIRMRLFTV